ncbi:VirK family protein [Streptomyces sioyaensis]|uniref:VirK family protein n=1 Tax=Streptomyces sioyaensis TaxID=67364 RepID=UPI0037D712D2
MVSGALLVAFAASSASGDEPGDGPHESRSSQGRSEAADYRQLLTALTDGKSVAVKVDFRQCTDEAGGKGPGATGGLHINSFLSTQDRISFSDAHDTLDQKNHKVTEYVRYQVTPDGKVSVTTTTLAADNQVDKIYQCPLGTGADFTWPTD